MLPSATPTLQGCVQPWSYLLVGFERRFGRLRLRHFVTQEVQHLLGRVPLGHLLAGAHPLRGLAAHRHLRGVRERRRAASGDRAQAQRAAGRALPDLHDELPSAGQTALRHHAVLRLLLLLGLLDLRQSADGIHPLAVLWTRLELSAATQPGIFSCLPLYPSCFDCFC